MLKRFGIVVTLSGVIVFAAIGVAMIRESGSSHPSTVRVSAATSGAASPAPSTVQSAANRLAQEMNDLSPTSADYFQGERGAAAKLLSSDEVGDARASYIVVLHGDFSLIGRGINAPPETGTIAYAIVDRSTGSTTDFGVMSTPVDLSSLGTPVTFDCCSTPSPTPSPPG